MSPTLGAEIRGLDLSQELNDTQLAEVKRAMAEYLVPAYTRFLDGLTAVLDGAQA